MQIFVSAKAKMLVNIWLPGNGVRSLCQKPNTDDHFEKQKTIKK